MRRLVLGNMLTAAHKAYLKVVFFFTRFSIVPGLYVAKKNSEKKKDEKKCCSLPVFVYHLRFVCSMKMNKVLNIENNVDVVKRQFPDRQKRSSFCLLCHEFGTRKKNTEKKMMNLVFIDAFHVLNKDQPHSQY